MGVVFSRSMDRSTKFHKWKTSQTQVGAILMVTDPLIHLFF